MAGMELRDKAEFRKRVQAWFALSGWDEPDDRALAMWWGILQPFPLGLVVAAIEQCAAETRDRPHPSLVRERVLTMDGRPDVETAWNTIRRLVDESESAVITAEMRDAWGACAPSMEGGDMVGARMAFKEFYTRAIGNARRLGYPAEFIISRGTDAHKHEIVMRDAVRAGQVRLPKPDVPLLPDGTPKPEPVPSLNPEEQLQKIRAMMAGMRSPTERMREAQAARAEAGRESEQARKAQLARDVAQYEAGLDDGTE